MNAYRNFLEETREELRVRELNLADIQFIVIGEENTDEYREYPLEAFINDANKNYDAGYGKEEIALSLKIVGKNWWLERHEYDGSEWWEFKTLPKKPENKKLPLRDLWGWKWGEENKTEWNKNL